MTSPGPGGAPTSVSGGSGYPAGATPVAATSGNVANANAVAALPAVAGKTNYVTGFDISNGGATALLDVLATLAGLVGGVTLTYVATALTAAGGASSRQVQFTPPLPANAINTAITLTVPALGVGNAQSVANIYGYVL